MQEPNQNTTHPTTDQGADAGALPTFAGDPLAGITSTILKNAPRVSPGFARKMNAQEIDGREDLAAAQVAAGDPDPPKDKDGNYYDPRYVITSRDGTPRLLKSGAWDLKKNPKTGQRYPRTVLKKRPPRPRAQVAKHAEQQPTDHAQTIETTEEPRTQAEPARLRMPPDLDTEAVQDGEPIAADPHADQVIGQDTHQAKAEALAMVCDAAFWNLSHFVADAQVVAQTQRQMGDVGRRALADGFATLDNVPDPPWYILAGLVYTPALVMMIGHEKSKPKRLGVKLFLGKTWQKIGGIFRRKKREIEETTTREAEPVRQDVF